MIYRLGGCWIAVDDVARHLVTRLPDSTEVYVTSSGDPASVRLAGDLGYASTWAMSRDHELALTWLALQDGRRYSEVIWLLAHQECMDWNCVRREEASVLDFQRHLDKEHFRPWDWAGTAG